jgi:hypothetical protein
MNLSPLPVQQFFGNNGRPLDGGLLFTYAAGTTTKIATYTDSSGGSLNTNPIVLDFRGECEIWLDPTLTYKFVLAPRNDSDPPTDPIWSVDNIATPIDVATLTQQFLGRIIYPRTAAESAANVTPENYILPPGEVERQQTNLVPGGTDMQPGFQEAIDSASTIQPGVFFSQANAIGRPLLIRPTTQQGIRLIGAGTPSAIIEPLSVDISVPAQNVNCCIFNQNNNPHFHLENMHFFAVTSYTGIGIYCKENGGADGSGQAMFSPELRNIFCAFPSTNSGFLTGALQNGVVDNVTFENAKGAFTIEGVGHADMFYTNCAMYNCYDHFMLQTADTHGSFTISINGLHAYVHNRGVLIKVQNWNGGIINDVILEPAAGNLGSTGLFHFNDCVNVICTDFLAIKRTDVPQCAVGIEIIGDTSVKFANGKISADVGLLFSDSGTVDVELENVDFTECATAAIRITAATAGVLRTRNCKFNDSTLSTFLSSAANALSWYSEGDEFINAGLGGSAGARNLILNSSGTIRIVNARIGQNNGSAAAAYYIDASGSGTVTVIDPQFVGTPPTGIVTGAQAVSIEYSVAADLTGAKTFQLAAGNSTITVNDADVTATCFIGLTPTNAAASVVQGSAQNLRVSARTSGTSFAVTTGDGTNAAGNANFMYRVIR